MGLLLMTISAVVFVYYTAWVIVLPFFDAGHAFRTFFPDNYYAILVPNVLLVLGLTVVGTFISLVMIRSSAAAKKKK